MKLKVVQWVLALLLLAPCTQAQSIWDATHLANVKQSIHEPFYATAYQALQAEADKLLDVQPLSVMMKEKVPASGNKHDYMSQARYYWPDPTKPDGLPYVSRDGESNPELNKLDRNRLGATASRVTTLALAWYFSGEEKYAQKATELIRVWFFDKDTRMNPNLEYAQMIPGHNGHFGIEQPRIALIHCTEKVSAKFPHSLDYVNIVELAEAGEFGNVIIDGPLDVKTSCEKTSGNIKGIVSPIDGEADVLIFPNIESGNAFYKAVSLFSHADMAGLLQGPSCPVVLPSRSDSGLSKYYSIAMACLTSGVKEP